MPISDLKISQQLEWDTPWSAGMLAVAAMFFVGWMVWQLVREGQIAQSRWIIGFIPFRLASAAVLLWMILGPTTVLTRTETHPRTLAVYVDTSSSMETVDQSDPLADRRWKIAGDYHTDPLAVVDRAAAFAAALRQQTIRLSHLVEQQAPSGERDECARQWRQLAEHCRESIDSDTLSSALNAEQTVLHQGLTRSLHHDLLTQLNEIDWLNGTNPGDRDQRLQELAELSEQFAVRCKVFAESFGIESSVPSNTSTDPVLISRLQYVVPALRQTIATWLGNKNPTFRLQLAQFSDGVSALPLDNWESLLNGNSTVARGTNLSELLKQIRDESGKEDTAAVIVISDGRHTATTTEDPRDLVAQLRIPLYAVPVGRGEMKKDVLLHHLRAPRSVIQHDQILIEAIVTAYQCRGEQCEVRLLEGDKVVQSRNIAFKNEQEDQRISFDVPTSRAGRREFKIEIGQIDGEHSITNNSDSVAVDVADAVLRLLVADGRARWEYQYLVNLFKRQERIEFDRLLFSPKPAGTGRRHKTHAFPETVEEWSEYGVVILGDVSPRQLTQASQESLREYVTERGGTVIIIAGQDDMPQSFEGEPLAQLIPVEPTTGAAPREGYRVELTAEGKTSNAMQLGQDLASTEKVWRDMSESIPIRYLSAYHKPKPNTQVFLNALPAKGQTSLEDTPAFLSWQTIGAGRVAFFSSPATYQLRVRNGDKYHNRFWGQFVRWIKTRSTLGGAKSVKLLADKSHYRRDDTVQITVELQDLSGKPVSGAAPELDLIQNNEVRSNINVSADPKIPGRYLGSFAANEFGTQFVRVRGRDVDRLLTAEHYVDPVQVQIEIESGPSSELLDPRADRPALEYLAERTGGLVLEPTALSEMLKVLPLAPRIEQTSQRTPLWDRWWCLGVVVVCLVLEWGIRKQVGLA